MRKLRSSLFDIVFLLFFRFWPRSFVSTTGGTCISELATFFHLTAAPNARLVEDPRGSWLIRKVAGCWRRQISSLTSNTSWNS
jgi:hypothetical protein